MMKRIMMTVTLMMAPLSVSAGVADELRAGFFELAWAGCNKAPLQGTEPEDKRLRLEDYRQAPAFLTAVGEYVYSFDRDYVAGMSELVSKSEQSDLLAIFVLNALKPYLSGLGYTELKRRYVDVALENLECMNGAFGIKDLNALKDIQLFQETAFRFLLKSWHSARPLLSERQRSQTASLMEIFGNAIAQGLTEQTLAKAREKLPDAEALALELVQNPFLRSRSASDVLVIQYLR